MAIADEKVATYPRADWVKSLTVEELKGLVKVRESLLQIFNIHERIILFAPLGIVLVSRKSALENFFGLALMCCLALMWIGNTLSAIGNDIRRREIYGRRQVFRSIGQGIWLGLPGIGIVPLGFALVRNARRLRDYGLEVKWWNKVSPEAVREVEQEVLGKDPVLADMSEPPSLG